MFSFCLGKNPKFIRRGYLSRHLVWTHGYSRSDARKAAMSAPRGDRPNQHGGIEDIRDDGTILDLLAEHDETVNVQDYFDKVDDFDTDLLANDVNYILDGFSIHGDVDDGEVSAHGDVSNDAVSASGDVNDDAVSVQMTLMVMSVLTIMIMTVTSVFNMTFPVMSVLTIVMMAGTWIITLMI